MCTQAIHTCPKYIESKSKLTKMWTCCSPACCTTHIHSIIEHQFCERAYQMHICSFDRSTWWNIMFCMFKKKSFRIEYLVIVFGLARTCCGNHSASEIKHNYLMALAAHAKLHILQLNSDEKRTRNTKMKFHHHDMVFRSICF